MVVIHHVLTSLHPTLSSHIHNGLCIYNYVVPVLVNDCVQGNMHWAEVDFLKLVYRAT